MKALRNVLRPADRPSKPTTLSTALKVTQTTASLTATFCPAFSIAQDNIAANESETPREERTLGTAFVRLLLSLLMISKGCLFIQ